MQFGAACLDVSARSYANKNFERDLYLMVVCLRLHVASAVLLMVGELRPPSSIPTALMMERSLKSDRTVLFIGRLMSSESPLVFGRH